MKHNSVFSLLPWLDIAWNFYVLLTMHLSMNLAINQLNAQNLVL